MTWDKKYPAAVEDLLAIKKLADETAFTPDLHIPLVVPLSVVEYARTEYGTAVVDGWIADGLIVVIQ